ncbi:MAG: sigma-70 family RNA polymerase sigma factor [Planctomycetales bacterium]|nr:sigma-70 family RNA polymerase sigma factor [Planctomycetales bacterium]
MTPICRESGEASDEESPVSIDNLHSCTVNELAVQASAGCSAAFAELNDRLYPRLVSFLVKRLNRSNAAAEDVAQETLTKAWQSISKYDSRHQFVTWLYTIAMRSAIDYLRSTQRAAHRPLLSDMACPNRPIHVVVDAKDSADNIWAQASRHLTDDQYTALWLRYAEEFSIKDVAKVMGKTQVGVRVLLHRGRNLLQSHLLASEDNADGKIGELVNNGAILPESTVRKCENER